MRKIEHKILVVDDNEKIQNAFRKMLREYGVEVLSAYTREEALTLRRKHFNELDLIAIDGRFTSEEGDLELVPEQTIALVKILAGEFLEDTPIVAIASQEEDRVAMMGAGCKYQTPHKSYFVNLVIDLLEIPPLER